MTTHPAFPALVANPGSATRRARRRAHDRADGHEDSTTSNATSNSPHASLGEQRAPRDLDRMGDQGYVFFVIHEYVDEALRRAKYAELDDGIFCAEVPELRGVLASAETLEACRAELRELIEEWVLVRVSRGLDVPRLGEFEVG